MIKISQLPEAEKYNGAEQFPIVQNGETRKGFPVFIDTELKAHIPENSAIVTKIEGVEINLISAKVIDGVATVLIGDKQVELHKDKSIIVTEDERKDGNVYSRINNNWVVRNCVTQINDKSAPTGGGKITLTFSDVKAHEENKNVDGLPYVSMDGKWIKLADGMQAELNKKADKVHTHEISDITGLATQLNNKAEKIHTHEISDVKGLQAKLDTIPTSIDTVPGLSTKLDDMDAVSTGISTSVEGKADKVHKHAISDVNGLETRLNNIDSDVSSIKARQETAMFYARNESITPEGSAGILPLTQISANKVSVASNVISVEEAGMYFVSFTADIGSDNTVVMFDGVAGLSTDIKGTSTRSGIFQLETSGKYSLKFTGDTAVIASSVTLYRI